MRNNLNFKTGITLIEVLLAVVILSVAIVPIVNYLPVSVETKIKAERKTVAIFLTEYMLEYWRSNILNDFNWPGSVGGGAGLFMHIMPDPYSAYNIQINRTNTGDLATVAVKTWYRETPNDAVTIYTQVSRR